MLSALTFRSVGQKGQLVFILIWFPTPHPPILRHSVRYSAHNCLKTKHWHRLDWLRTVQLSLRPFKTKKWDILSCSIHSKFWILSGKVSPRTCSTHPCLTFSQFCSHYFKDRCCHFQTNWLHFNQRRFLVTVIETFTVHWDLNDSCSTSIALARAAFHCQVHLNPPFALKKKRI